MHATSGPAGALLGCVVLSGMFCHRGRQAACAVSQDVLAFGGGAGQPNGELSREAGRGAQVMGAEQWAAGPDLSVAVWGRPVADGVGAHPVQVLAHWAGRRQQTREDGLAVDGPPVAQPRQDPAEVGSNGRRVTVERSRKARSVIF